MAKKTNDDPITITKVMTGKVTVFIRGTSPLIYNCMSMKTKQGLLSPIKKSKAEQNATAKHNPIEEYRGSFYKAKDGPTLLTMPAVAFKRAMASAALDLGGAAKTQMDRLVWAVGETVPVWGIPELRMDVVRMKNIDRTPDIRTRGCLRQWATKIELAFAMPAINETTVANLLEGAGLIRGVGDYRQEKGAGNFGQFTITAPEDGWDEITKIGGREAQIAAYENPSFYNEESEELFRWWESEMKRRGLMTKEEREAELLGIDEGDDEDEDERGIIFDKKSNGHAEAR